MNDTIEFVFVVTFIRIKGKLNKHETEKRYQMDIKD